jgi:hypothetical protein
MDGIAFMTPIKFTQANANLGSPQGMTEEQCGSLPVYRDGQTCLSCWGMTWRERLTILFKGRVWLWVWMGNTQPPVKLEADVKFSAPKEDK